MAKQKKDLGLVVWAFGWLLAIATSFKKFAAELKVPFEAFERLGSPEGEGTLKKIVALVRDEWAAIQPSGVPTSAGFDALPADHYRVHVPYGQFPSFAELQKLFDGVSKLFDGRAWQKIAACIGMDETPGEKVFWVRHFAREIGSEEVIAEAEKDGYRPATHEDTVAFAKANPDLQRKFWIIALGSFTLAGGRRRYVAVLDGDGGRRGLGDGWFGGGWDADGRFLLVRK